MEPDPVTGGAPSVYIATDSLGRCKIGNSANPNMRRRQLEREFGFSINLAKVFPAHWRSGWIETVAHWSLADSHDGREWFKVALPVAIAAVKRATKKVDAGEPVPVRFVKGGRPASSHSQ